MVDSICALYLQDCYVEQMLSAPLLYGPPPDLHSAHEEEELELQATGNKSTVPSLNL